MENKEAEKYRVENGWSESEFSNPNNGHVDLKKVVAFASEFADHQIKSKEHFIRNQQKVIEGKNDELEKLKQEKEGLIQASELAYKVIERETKKLVYIKWCDATVRNEWLSKEEAIKWADSDGWICEDVGWILKETNKYILLTSRKSNDNKEYLFNCITKIPTTWIIEAKTISNDTTDN